MRLSRGTQGEYPVFLTLVAAVLAIALVILKKRGAPPFGLPSHDVALLSGWRFVARWAILTTLIVTSYFAFGKIFTAMGS